MTKLNVEGGGGGGGGGSFKAYDIRGRSLKFLTIPLPMPSAGLSRAFFRCEISGRWARY